MDDFSAQIANRVLRETSKMGSNFVCSPLSISAILNLVAAGSEGPELDRLLSLLGAKSVADVNARTEKIMAVAESTKGEEIEQIMKEKEERKRGHVISFANGGWIDHWFDLKPSLQQVFETIYKSEIKHLDFRIKVEEVIYEVNKWAENATKGLIRNIVDEETVNGKTVFILANALYFKGSWGSPFNKESTEDKDFYLLNGEIVKVPQMHKMEGYYHYDHFDEGFRVLKLPYKDGVKDERRFSMLFFLPDEKDGLPNLLKRVSSNPTFFCQQFGLPSQELRDVWIPKFKFSYNFLVSNTVKDMGLGLPPANHMVVNGHLFEHSELHIYHKSLIEVNEGGTEAVAITYESDDDVGFCLYPPSPPKLEFIADHPFLFVLREDTSGIIFFIGAMLNPLEKID